MEVNTLSAHDEFIGQTSTCKIYTLPELISACSQLISLLFLNHHKIFWTVYLFLTHHVSSCYQPFFVERIVLDEFLSF